MKTVRSEECSTGMGGTHLAAVLCDGEWLRVSNHPTVQYMGRESGYECYEVDVADDAITAQFDRSNRGNEYVDASNGMSWRSFNEADRWASGESTSETCPHCGRAM